MMSVQRKRYSADLKAKVALEAIRGQKTANEIASEYGVHPTQIAQWKKQALDSLPVLFSTRATDQQKNEEELIASLLRGGWFVQRRSSSVSVTEDEDEWSDHPLDYHDTDAALP